MSLWISVLGIIVSGVLLIFWKMRDVDLLRYKWLAFYKISMRRRRGLKKNACTTPLFQFLHYKIWLSYPTNYLIKSSIWNLSFDWEMLWGKEKKSNTPRVSRVSALLNVSHELFGTVIWYQHACKGCKVGVVSSLSEAQN